jgi:glycosyltransferase involved in cell wall biosynthesis
MQFLAQNADANSGKNGAKSSSRNWSVNGRFLSRDLTGVDRYAIEILKAMDALISEQHPISAGLDIKLLCPAGSIKESPFSHIPLRELPKAPGHLWEQLILPQYVAGGALSLCNSGPLASQKQIVCIHDVNTRLAPESYTLPFRAAYRLLHPMLGMRVAQLVTVSHFSKSSMAQFGIGNSENIAVIPDGHEHALEWKPDRSSLVTANLPERFVLLVGSKAPHKNVGLIFSIASELAGEGIHVLVTGGKDKNVYANDASGELPPTVRHLGRVTDDDLALLYRRALCLVFPSITEGFGLPALEAMTLGCPVIASNVASLPEVCNEAVLYATPRDGGTWLTAIKQIACDKTLRERLAAAGPMQAKKFSWRKSAERYLELMSALDQQSMPRQMPQ